MRKYSLFFLPHPTHTKDPTSHHPPFFTHFSPNLLILFLFFFDTVSQVTELTAHAPVCPFPLDVFSKFICDFKAAFKVSPYLPGLGHSTAQSLPSLAQTCRYCHVKHQR